MQRLRIGISACFFHADPKRPIFKGKTLQYIEQSLARWVLAEDALSYMIPSPAESSPVSLRDFVQDLDGLVLEGGSDVAPESYGQKPLKPEWGGDRVRDVYEIGLVREFLAAGKPVFGVCRGLQLLNVAFGGTLIQDIGQQIPGARVHRDWEIYDQNFHAITLEPGSLLAKLAAKTKTAKVNSIHHQAIDKLGQGLEIEARSESDGVIEAARASSGPWAYAVQWHPEFHDTTDASLFDTRPLLREFLKHARESRR